MMRTRIFLDISLRGRGCQSERSRRVSTQGSSPIPLWLNCIIVGAAALATLGLMELGGVSRDWSVPWCAGWLFGVAAGVAYRKLVEAYG